MHVLQHMRGDGYPVLPEWQGSPEVHHWGHHEEGQVGLALPDWCGAVP